jgi:hypothetical protein
VRERSRLWMDFEEVDRSGSQVLNKNVVFGQQTYAQGERVNSALSWRIFTLAYTYSLYRSDWLEVGTGLAVHMVEAQAHASLDRGTFPQDESVASAYPTIPLDVTWRLTRQVAAVARAEYFRLTTGHVSGSAMNLHGDVQYRLVPNFAVGLGYSLERITSSSSDMFSIDTRGPEAFFRASF